MPDGPLAGVRVLDLTNVLAGPYCAYQLALLGAEVIKVERPGTGDLARQLGADPDLNRVNMGISFQAQNAGKKSMTLDLKPEAGKEVLRRLVACADVLIENFRPGVMDRLGLGYASLKAVNPHLVYCAISGFGQDGPWRDNPAYDQIVQGIAGVMSITGTEETGPLRTGYPAADTIGGLTAAFAIAAALNAPDRGAFIDVSMTEAMLSTMGWVVSNYLIGGVVPGAHGNENVTSAPSGTFRTADRPINIAANRDEQWQALARLLGREDLISHPDYLTREDRKRNRAALRSVLEAELSTRPAALWVEALNAMGIPAGPVLSVPQVLGSEQIIGRGLTATYDRVGGRVSRILAAPVVVNGVRPAAKDAPPELGADTEALLCTLGYATGDIDRMRADGVI
jgi:crotonobetainyl-CoA:carnitine CoA-transferase CaiB-like acyl-CoA transferase